MSWTRKKRIFKTGKRFKNLEHVYTLSFFAQLICPKQIGKQTKISLPPPPVLRIKKEEEIALFGTPYVFPLISAYF